jgi:hypothetical protein
VAWVRQAVEAASNTRRVVGRDFGPDGDAGELGRGEVPPTCDHAARDPTLGLVG